MLRGLAGAVLTFLEGAAAAACWGCQWRCQQLLPETDLPAAVWLCQVQRRVGDHRAAAPLLPGVCDRLPVNRGCRCGEVRF